MEKKIDPSTERYWVSQEDEMLRMHPGFDFNSIEGIRAIPLSCSDITVFYYLNSGCFNRHWHHGRTDLAIECLIKAQEYMYLQSPPVWHYDNFVKLVSYLHTAGRHDEARVEQARIELYFKKHKMFPRPHFFEFESIKHFKAAEKLRKELMADHERKKQLRNEYYWMQEFLPDLCPKSINGYSRMKSAKSKNYTKLVDEARSKGFIIR